MSTLSQFFGGSSAQTIPCELLVVGGGGGGGAVSGAGSASGGGGGGQVVYTTRLNLDLGITYTVVVGAENNASAFGYIIAAGGSDGSTVTAVAGTAVLDAAPGGGGGGSNRVGGLSGGLGGPLTSGFSSSSYWISGSGNGSDGVESGKSGDGGNKTGVPVDITGSSLIYGRGGVGRTPDGTVAGANGGSNTGNGGGGGSLVSTPPSGLPASAGGSGVVIIAYPDTYAVPTSITGTYNEPTRSGYRVYRFTGSGSITF